MQLYFLAARVGDGFDDVVRPVVHGCGVAVRPVIDIVDEISLGNKGKAVAVNCQLMRDVQLKRKPFASPKLTINPKIKSLEDLETWVTMDDFEVSDYQHHEAIKYPFSV